VSPWVFAVIQPAGTYNYEGDARRMPQSLNKASSTEIITMKHRTRTAKLLLSSLGGAALVSAALTAVPPAASGVCAGGSYADPITGVCWSQNNPSNSWGGSGNIPCFPGRLGLCLAALQNTPIPGAALQPMPAAGPGPRSGPRGTWP
jgi:hypothetical protein